MNLYDLTIECEWGDYKRHLINFSMDNKCNYEYYVICCINKMPQRNNFNYTEFPIVIFHKGKQIYKDSEYFEDADWQDDAIISNKIYQFKERGFELVNLAYKENEVEFFSNKYFEVLI